MLFADFAKYLTQIEATTKRLEITGLLADLYRQLAPEEVRVASYLLQGSLFPPYQSVQFQLSTKMILRVLHSLAQSWHLPLTEEQLLEQFKETGDLGIVTQQVLIDSKRPHFESQLSISAVYQQLLTIAQTGGTGSQEIKVKLTSELLSSLEPNAGKFAVRIVLGKLRLGFSDMTLIDALSWAVVGSKALRIQIEDAYQRRADIGTIAELLLSSGVDSLAQLTVQVDTPVVPALCQRLNSAQEVIQKMQHIYAEPKYDGTRVQIHFRRDAVHGHQISSFTRNLEESSGMFPELEGLPSVLQCESCILDSEAVGYDPQTNQIVPFQITIQRKRKHGIAEKAVSIPLRFFVFDILEKDGQPLIHLPLAERKALLSQTLTSNDTFSVAEWQEFTTAEPLQQYHEQQLTAGLEGIVMKQVSGPYVSGRKQFQWVKMKEAEGTRGKLNDTIDAIVMGYYLAQGKNIHRTVGAILLGLLNSEGKIVTISKVGSGLSDELASEFLARITDLPTTQQPSEYIVDKNLAPDVWLHPKLVIEVAADEITTSPSHTAGKALRFPRFIRFRDDKHVSQATTLDELLHIQVPA